VRCGVRDPRLLEEWALATAAKRRNAGTRLLSSVPESERAQVDRLLADWWLEVLSQDLLSEQDKMEHVERLRTRCSSLSPELQKLALTAPSALARGTGEVDGNVGARLLGESAAAVVRCAPTAVELDRAVRLLADCWEAVESLEEALLRPPAWPTSTDTLSVRSVPIEGLLGHHFDRVPSSDVLVEEESKARERGVSAYFWGHYPELPLNETSLVRLLLVARRDWADVAIQADALPLRAFRDWLWLSLHLDDDRESILALLRAAPPVFANDAWTGSTCALAALRASVRHAEKLHDRLAQATRAYPPAPDAGPKLKALEEDELPAWLRSVAEVAIARSDGRVLLTLFASTLVRHDLTPPWNGQRSWPASRHALRAIYQSLAPKPTLAECQHVAGIGGVPSNRTTIEFATYLITSAVLDADPKGVWAWYRELLLKSDDDLCWQAKNWRRALCYVALAQRLGQLPDPYEEWRAVWRALFVTDRERARFATHDQNAQYPSLHLLRVGAELLRQDPSRSGEWQFLEEVLDCTHILLEGYARRFNPIKPEVVLDMLDVAVRIPGGAWRTVAGNYRTLLSSATNRIYVAAVLLEAGALFSEIESAIEVAPHRLVDTIAELRNDISVHHLCAFVSEAAKRHEHEQSEEASAP
jgi:hypothetical protein